MTTPQMPAGWYSDPDGSGGQRYWDGTAWTRHQVPAPQTPPPPPPGPSAPPPPATPASAPRSGGAHRAAEDLPEPGDERGPASANTAIPPLPPTNSDTPNGDEGVHRKLLVRYLAVCSALLAVLVAVSVYAAFFADDGSASFGAFDDRSTTLIPAATPTTTAGGGWGETTDTETTTVTPTLTPTFPENSDATDGAFAFTVDTVEITPSVSSIEFPVDKTATGEYVVVHMTVANISDEAATFLGTFQKLMAAGEVYSIDDEATFYAGGALAELNPGDQVKVAVAFDVPPGTDPEVIELHADPLSPGVEVSLP